MGKGKEKLIDMVCRPWCAYFKPDRIDPDEECGPLAVIRDLIDARPELADDSGPRERSSAEALTDTAAAVCPACPYRAADCDFADPDGPPDAPPCGGLAWLAGRLQAGALDPDRLARSARVMRFVSLGRHAVLKNLETPHIYHLGRDELYEINSQAFKFLHTCDGTRRVADLGPDPDFLDFCLEEGLLELTDGPRPITVHAGGQSPRPSLRYLEVQITRRCNLSCRHCYLGPARKVDMAPEVLGRVAEDFCSISGLRIMISGGEPLSHPRFWEINDRLADTPLRRVLLSNGTLLDAAVARRLAFHEVQISLDGMEAGHDALRGPGSFERAMGGLRAAAAAGLQVSVATMVHSANLDQFDDMAALMDELGVIEWGIDAPCLTGSDTKNLAVSPARAAAAMAFGFGGAYHGAGGQGFACGRHLATVTPEGMVAPCGFYEPLGPVEEGLARVWSRRKWLRLDELECAGCPHLDECGGGCRFRAGSPKGRDPVMCAVYNREE
jgi:radical SAM protein with 4Fe4S-binding SPASM domain